MNETQNHGGTADAELRSIPLTIDIGGRRCLCIGGGAVAARRVPALLAAGGLVEVIAPKLHPDLTALVSTAQCTWQQRTYQHGDAAGAFFVLAATGDSATDSNVASEALPGGALVCVAGKPQLGNVRFMATVRRGSLMVALQTGGAAPVVTSALRAYLDRILPENVGTVIDTLAELREEMRGVISSADERTHRWQAALAAGYVVGALEGDREAIQRIRALVLAPVEQD
jgi:precorrin-2 dehydrogenase/sirohydrochlorin ferrochelatase